LFVIGRDAVGRAGGGAAAVLPELRWSRRSIDRSGRRADRLTWRDVPERAQDTRARESRALFSCRKVSVQASQDTLPQPGEEQRSTVHAVRLLPT
jgi:hypothetical protein